MNMEDDMIGTPLKAILCGHVLTDPYGKLSAAAIATRRNGKTNLMKDIIMGTLNVDLSFRGFQSINADRCDVWHAAAHEKWSLADWGNALGGECGEAQNVIKKLRRIETGSGGNTKGEEWDALIEMLGKELADTVTYAFLTASMAGIDLQSAVVDKFNAVSDKQGLPHKIRLDDTLTVAPVFGGRISG